MKLLITGSEGQIGSLLTKYASTNDNHVLSLNHKMLDISQANMVEQTIAAFRPDIIINAAAYTAVDKAQTDEITAYAINYEGVANLARTATKYQAIFMHISTDYVFSGDKMEAYNEDDFAEPANIYGASKLAGERATTKYCDNHIILRTSWVFGENGNNFVKTMLKLAQTHTKLNIVCDQIGAPTYAGDIALALIKIAYQIYFNRNIHPWGIYHYCGTPVTTWAGFAQSIFELAYQKELLTHKPVITAIPSSQYHTDAIRPMNSSLDCNKILKYFDIEKSDWHENLLTNLKAYL